MTRPPWAEPPSFPPPLPPPQAVSAIAPAMPVAISAAERLLSFTCDFLLVPPRRGERTGFQWPDARSGTGFSRTGHAGQVDACPARRADSKHAQKERPR